MEHRAFLSLDVVGSSEMKRGAPELAVEYSFNQYRRWVEAVVISSGGEAYNTAGDGVMCAFREDAAALRAARHLQGQIGDFNRDHNRLAIPFRIRCGVSAGELAIDPGTPLGYLQSAVIDRAAHLQNQAEPGDIVVGSELADTVRV